MKRAVRLCGWAWSLFVAVLLSQRLFSAVLLIGWIFRVMQRETVRTWWHQSANREKGDRFKAFCAAEDSTALLAERPRWCLSAPAERKTNREAGTSLWSSVPHTLFVGAARNTVSGIQAVFNTSVLVAPAGMLWWLGWSSGWNNSFHKGYEQTFLGASIALAGIGWFCVAMLHVPLAQARQASTGDWRRFYDFRLVAKLARIRWRGSLMLAGAYSVLGIFVSVVALGPQIAGTSNLAMQSWSDAELLAWLDGYYYWTAWAFVPAVLMLHVLAARIYAGAMVDAIGTGAVDPIAASSLERSILARLELDRPATAGASSGMFVVATATASRLALRTAVVTALLLIWFSLAAQVFVTQFFAYQGPRGWLNQPLVLIPSIRSIPSHIRPEVSRTAEAAPAYSDNGNQ